MKKDEFLKLLEKRLSGLPKADIEDRLEFYSESIDDRVEEGKTEEEAINDIGSIDEVVNNILRQTPLTKIVKEKVKPKRSLSSLEIVLLIVGFPLWFPLLMVCGVLMLVAYLLTWILVIVTYALELGAIGYGAVAAYAFIASLSTHMDYRFALVFFFVCVAATKLSIRFTKSILLGIKRKIVGGNE